MAGSQAARRVDSASASAPNRMIWGTGYAGRARLVPLEQAIDLVTNQLDLSQTAIEDIFWRTPLALFGFEKSVTSDVTSAVQ